MSFHEVQFPPQVARGAVGGPGFSTSIFAAASGYGQRNIGWSKARGRWQVGHRVKTPAQFGEVLAFFAARMGRAYGFRFKLARLPLDHRHAGGCVADRSDHRHQRRQRDRFPDDKDLCLQRPLLRRGNSEAGCRHRARRPRCGRADKWLVGGTTTGRVTFTTVPGAGVVVAAGFEFDVSARFGIDELDGSWDTVNTRSVPNVPIVEIRV